MSRTRPGNDERRPGQGGDSVEQFNNHRNDSASGRQGDSLAEHAAAYARAGIGVLALHTPAARGCSCANPDCGPVGKHPRTRNGKDDATTDLRRIAALWTCWPDANIGLRPAEGVVVLDVDPRAGGATALAAVLAEHGRELPSTLTAYTGGDGLHIWYRCPGPYRGKLAPGVDLKGHNGYLVAPPSLHKSGRRYTWASALEIAPAPLWLQRLIRRPVIAPTGQPVPTGAGADDGLVRVVADAAEGGRNNALHWAASRAAERGAPAELLDRLRHAARTAGLDDHEIERTLRSALNGWRRAA